MTPENQAIFNMDCLTNILDTLRDILEILKQKPITGQYDIQQDEFNVPERLQYRWKNQYNAIPVKGETNNLPSKTIPDQSLSIKEIMTRFAQGLPLGGQKVPMYDEDPENPMPDLSKMDIIDQHETIQAAKSEVRDIATKYRTEQEKKKQDVYNDYKKKYEDLDKKYQKDIKQGNFKFNPADQGTTDPAK